MNTIQHADWLKSQGYRQFSTEPGDVSKKIHFQKKISDDLYVDANAYVFNAKYNIPGGTRYEIEAQLNGSITMNVALFTLFDHNLQERLAGIEAYVIELAALHASKEL